MALFGLIIIGGWLVYKFFTKWLWWFIVFGILVNVIAWFIKFGWIIIMVTAVVVAAGLFTLALHNYRIQHQNK